MSVRAPEEQDRVTESDEVDSASAPVSRRPLVAGAVGSLWALLVGLGIVTCLVMLTWAFSPSPSGDSAAAWQAVGAVWLGAHLVPLTVGGQAFTLLPIGGLLLGLLLTRRSGRWAARMLPEPSAVEIVWILLGAALTYGAGGAGVAWLIDGGSTSADPRWAAGVAALVAAVGTLWGLSRQAGLVGLWHGRTREAVWRTGTAGAAAVLGLLGVGGALVTAGLVTGFSEVVAGMSDLDPGAVGAAGLTLLGALSLPTLDVWAMSVLVGPGFDLGGLGSISAFGGSVESVPALPVLAAIPATPPGWAPVLLVVPVALGVLAGRIRWRDDLPTALGTVLSGLGLAVVVAGLVAGLGALASGSLGDGRLADLGPPLLPVTASATGLVLLGFLLEAAYQATSLAWRLHRAEQNAQTEGGSEQDPAEASPVEGRDLVASAGEGELVAERGAEDGSTAAGELPGGEVSGQGPRAVAGMVAGLGGAVTSGIAGVGASAVSVVAGAGSAVTSLVAGAAGAEGADPEGGSGEDSGLEGAEVEDSDTPPAESGEESVAEGEDSLTLPDAAPAPDSGSADAPEGGVLDLRSDEAADHAPGPGDEAGHGDDPAPVPSEIHRDVGAIDVTDEIPIIRPVPAPDPAQA